MKKSFWKNAWENHQIGFHLNETHPLLIKFIKSVQLKNNAKILVPLCGKSLDMIWLRDQGYDVWGVEFCSKAITQFFNENNIDYTCEEIDQIVTYKAYGITLFCCDFLDFPKSKLQNVDLLYDRAAQVALPLEIRSQYQKKLREELGEHAQMLLITLDYNQEKVSGPPFALSDKEVIATFQDRFEIKNLFSETTENISKRFLDAGLQSMSQSVFFFSPRMS